MDDRRLQEITERCEAYKEDKSEATDESVWLTKDLLLMNDFLPSFADLAANSPRDISFLLSLLAERDKEIKRLHDKFTSIEKCDVHQITDCDFCKNLMDAHVEIERLREAQRWIPITERLPEDAALVLIYPVYGEVYSAKYWQDLNHFRLWDYSVEPGDITHWMPLPQRPTEGE